MCAVVNVNMTIPLENTKNMNIYVVSGTASQAGQGTGYALSVATLTALYHSALE